MNKAKRKRLEVKINTAKSVIKNFYEYMDGKVYVSFSGGKDSVVLLHLVRSLYPEVVGVFADTGLEFPEIKQFVKTIDNIDTIRPSKKFKDIIEVNGIPYPSKENAQKVSEFQHGTEHIKNIRKNGYPKTKAGKLPNKWLKLVRYEQEFGIKVTNKCCYYLKKSPFFKYSTVTKKAGFVGTTIDESGLRATAFAKTGFNIYKEDKKRSKSLPISLFTEQDIWEYIKINKLNYSKIYDMGYSRTGCMYCLFGIHLEKGENRLQKLKKTHPKQHKFVLGLKNYKKLLDLEGIDYDIKESLEEE